VTDQIVGAVSHWVIIVHSQGSDFC